MNANQFLCIQCKQPIEAWITRRPEFICPNCERGYRSTYKRSLKYSVLLGLTLWLISTLIIFLFTQSWAITLSLSIEICAIGSALISILYHYKTSRIQAQ